MDSIAEENSDLKVGKINVDNEPELAQAFGVMNIPTLVAIKDGKVIDKMVGVRPKETILSMFDK
ncbi:Thioredoxin C-1 [bioreactor metagenome]|uniref:Thioredoxin C-1 n=1 Tax=bioreactor metagenome TaxID=1076179 RepID=A0A645C8S7_9ZZZZ